MKINIIYKTLIGFILLAMPISSLMAQEEKKSSVPIQKAAFRVSKKLEEPKHDEETLAEDYVRLAKELSIKKEYAKAEEYWDRALRLYNKLNQKEKAAEVTRELAKLQEAKGETSKAGELFETAGQNSLNILTKELNLNDAQRLRNENNPRAQSGYIEKNIQLLEEKDVAAPSEEIAQAYVQMADVNVLMNQPQAALENYEMALQNVSEKAPEAFSIQRKMAEVYLSEQQSEKGINTLVEVYHIALTENNTIEATRSLELLTREYHKQGKDKKAMALPHEREPSNREQSHTWQ
jgi:tetratricopeptide (TPR) repeat protein